MVRLDTSWPKQNPIMYGILKKQGEINIVFQTRHFYLKDFFLFYYKNKTDLEPKGVILINNVQSEQTKSEVYIKASRRMFRLKAENEETAKKWNAEIKQVSASPLRVEFQNEGEDSVIGDEESKEMQNVLKKLKVNISRLTLHTSTVCFSISS